LCRSSGQDSFSSRWAPSPTPRAQDWSLVDGFAVATLTTSSIADPELTITGAPIKIFTVFYILVGIGILVELARQLGFAYVQVRREEQAAKADKADHAAET